ncbi:DUF2269 family protein [Shimia litoralis]|uniref:DUF2269 family protein n=1 Tax=Shimia litoralis TaxID=420403 RepID=A0A4U7N1Y7_9RHOB|nr:DUF2269 family protein [Shimia litoralis]TKZ19397.1 DUF2269 family protein [Shimia litoralis]
MPDLLFSVKLVHILSVILMVGATIINGVIHSHARRLPPTEATALLQVISSVNLLMMGPSLLVIPVSGLWMVKLLGYDVWTGWLSLSIALSMALCAAFLVGDRFERRLLDIAQQASLGKLMRLPTCYEITFAKAAPIGGAALVMSVAALVLMVFKPF